jgi:hypothetical protein
VTDLEQRLRNALNAKAAEVRPDPATWERVQRRVVLRRIAMWTAGGLAVAGAAAAITLVLPSLLPANRVEFEPAPIATQPPAGPAQSPVGTLVYGDGADVYDMDLRDSKSFPVMEDLPGAVLDVAAINTSEGQGLAIVRDRGDTNCGELEFSYTTFSGSSAVAGGGATTGGEIDGEPVCVTSAAFSPDGRYLTTTEMHNSNEGVLRIVEWNSEGPGQEVLTQPLHGASPPFDIDDWVWERPGRGHLVMTASAFSYRLKVYLPRSFRIAVEANDLSRLRVANELKPFDDEWSTDWFTIAANGGHAIQVRYADEPDPVQEAQLVELATNTSIRLPDGFAGDLHTGPPSGAEAQGAWISVIGTTVALGDGQSSNAWRTEFRDGAYTQLRQLPSMTTGQLVLGAPGPDAPVETVPTVPPTVPPATKPPPPTDPSTTTVEVYFSPADAANTDCSITEPVTREVTGKGVLRAALTQLLAGPTAEELQQGYASLFGPDTAGALNNVSITDGVARVDLADIRSSISSASSSCGSAAFLSALDNTVMQFPSVQQVVYSFDGSVPAFYEFVGLVAPSLPAADNELPAEVIATRDAIRDTAGDGNLDRLRELITIGPDFTCYPGPGGRPCVAYWEELTQQGGDPLGTLVQLLGGQAGKQSTADRWVWPAGAVNLEQPGYRGPGFPRVGIDADGTWRFYVDDSRE